MCSTTRRLSMSSMRPRLFRRSASGRQWHTGTRTSKSAVLRKIFPKEVYDRELSRRQRTRARPGHVHDGARKITLMVLLRTRAATHD
jgi:hypothetical protein